MRLALGHPLPRQRSRANGRDIATRLGRTARSVARSVLIRINAAELDRQLARGDGPVTEPLQAARAALILRRRQREVVADGWRRRLTAARDHRQPWFSSVVPVQREEVLMAEPAILSLIERLIGDAVADARVVARARVLLVDATSEVYSPQRPGELREAVMSVADRTVPD